jgi:hypothetical protein
MSKEKMSREEMSGEEMSGEETARDVLTIYHLKAKRHNHSDQHL